MGEGDWRGNALAGGNVFVLMRRAGISVSKDFGINTEEDYRKVFRRPGGTESTLPCKCRDSAAHMNIILTPHIYLAISIVLQQR